MGKVGKSVTKEILNKAIACLDEWLVKNKKKEKNEKNMEKFNKHDDVHVNMYAEQLRHDSSEGRQASLERFLEVYDDNYDFRSLVQETFFDAMDLWKIKEYGRDDDEELHDHCFDELNGFDIELLWENPIACVKNFIEKRRSK